jgi:nicotinamidase-related amidase
MPIATEEPARRPKLQREAKRNIAKRRELTLELIPPLAALCPPAIVIDRMRYSGFAEPKLLAHPEERGADAAIISGLVCVLATVLSAVDLGYRVIVVRDALCSSSDEGHARLLRLYHTRLTSRSRQPMPRRCCRGGSDDHEPAR